MNTKITRLSYIFIAFTFLLVIQSCDDKMKDLIDTKWTLEKITTKHGQELIPDDYYTITVSENLLTVKLDVNACRISYTFEEGNIINLDKQSACTRACCDSDLAKNFVEKLVGKMKVNVEGDKLTLTGNDVIEFRRWTKNDVKREKTENYLKIKRTGCFGTCPIYEMTLFEDGSAKYYGRRFVEVTGEAQYSFEKSRIEELFLRAARLDFKSLQPVYDNPMISDMESIFIEYNGVPIKVRYKVDVPKALLELISDMHGCAKDAQWVKE